jgi:hypothetical protein
MVRCPCRADFDEYVSDIPADVCDHRELT